MKNFISLEGIMDNDNINDAKTSDTKKKKKKPKDRDYTKPLTDREMQVLKYLITGLSNTEIAKKMNLSSHTIKAHVCSILHKMSVTDRVQAAVKTIREGILK